MALQSALVSLATMISKTWPVLADAAIKGAILLAAAGLLALAMRRASAAQRHLVWLLALGSTLALPIFSAMLPAWRILPHWPVRSATAMVQPPEIELTPAPQPAAQRPLMEPRGVAEAYHEEPLPPAAADANVESPIIPVTPPAWWTGLDWKMGLAAAWILGMAALLFRYVLGLAFVWRIGREARPVTDQRWLGLLGETAGALRMRRRVALLESPRCTIPMTWGIFRPVVLLPARTESWPAERRHVVLAHELAHVKRRDCLAQLIAQAARALVWFNPLVWLAWRRLLIESERACDDLVLAQGSKASDYAEHLLTVASGSKAEGLFSSAAIAMARPSQLQGRLLAILDEKRNRRRLTRIAMAAALLIVAGIVVPLSVLKAVEEEQSAASQALSSADAAESPGIPAPAAEADGPTRQQAGHDKTAGTASVTLDHQRSEYFLGENILIDYRLKNSGHEQLPYEKGAFYPTLRRNDGYQVTAVPVDGAGKPLAPPAEASFSDPKERSGPLANWKLAPGEAYVQTLYLPRYVRLEKPGRYLIRIANVERFNPKTHFSAGETTLTLKEPTPAGAQAIYQRMKHLPREPVAGIGETSKVEIADFEALVAPVYLPILRAQALLGDRDALEALGNMRSADTNAALIEAIDRALGKDDLELAVASYRQMSGLPDPRFYPGFYPDSSAEDRDSLAARALVKRVWRPEFVDPIRRFAARLVHDAKPVGLEEAWRIYEAVGKPDDLGDVMLGYTKAIELTRTLSPETNQFPRPRGAAYGYPFAVRMLLKRGANAPADPKTPGEIGAYLVALRSQNDFRPAGWAERLAGWLEHEIPYVRELVLEYVPEPVPAAVLDRLPKLLAGDSGDLQIAAFRLAQKNPREALRDPLLEILRRGRASKAERLLEEYLLDAAADAARANGITADRLADIWLGRIDNSDLGVQAVRRLLLTVIDNEGAGESAESISPEAKAATTARWRRFIDEHRQELREGHRFKLGDPQITPDLFPAGFHFRLQGRPWPPYHDQVSIDGS